MSRLRAAVIGAGSMGVNHARVYSELDSVELVGVADPNRGAADRASRRYHTAAFADCETLIAAVSPDLVSVTVPTRLHEEVALEAIRSGTHVLIEKPLALSVEAAQHVVEAAAKAHVKLSVGHIERFNPAVVEIRQRLARGELGRIFQVHARRLSPFPGRIDDVGVILDLATHDIDVIRYLLGGEVERVFAEYDRRSGSDHEDLVTALLRLSNGAMGVLDVNWLTPTKVRQLAILGESGMYVADYLTQDLYWYTNTSTGSSWEALSAFRGAWEGDMVKVRLEKREPLRAELESFVHAVAHDEPPVVSGDDGMAAIIIGLALMWSAETNLPVSPQVPTGAPPHDWSFDGS